MDELSDFMEAVALDRPPLSTLDLAIQVTKVLYAGYCAAEEEKRIYLDAQKRLWHGIPYQRRFLFHKYRARSRLSTIRSRNSRIGGGIWASSAQVR